MKGNPHLSINISNHSINRKNISTKSKFFNEFIYKIYADRIEFSKPSLDTKGKIIKPSITDELWYQFNIELDIPIGRYPFDEESNQDKIIIYFND